MKGISPDAPKSRGGAGDLCILPISLKILKDFSVVPNCLVIGCCIIDVGLFNNPDLLWISQWTFDLRPKGSFLDSTGRHRRL